MSPLQPFSKFLSVHPSSLSRRGGASISSGVMRPLSITLALYLILTSLGCEKKQSSLIDYIGSPPALLQTSILPSSINSDSINVHTSRSPDDTLLLSTIVTAQVKSSPDNPIAAVRFALRSPVDNGIISDGELFDDGLGTDKKKADGIFTGQVSFQIQRVEIGIFRLEVFAEGQNGFQSNTEILPLSVYRGNRPPVLSYLPAPDTVQLGADTLYLTVRVKANDPDGLSDVARVIFNSYLPNGTPSSSNPIQMYDDGSQIHGDDKAGDGVYSRVILLPPGALVGTFRFEFQAFDRSNSGSNILVQHLTVKP